MATSSSTSTFPDLRPLPIWDGGSNHYDGPHDDFCFVCGSTLALVNCQTCENSYHVDCMSPTPSPLPDFWFCPHCMDREWHVPVPDTEPSLELFFPPKENGAGVQQGSEPATIAAAAPGKKPKFATALDRALYSFDMVTGASTAQSPSHLPLTLSRPKRAHSPPAPILAPAPIARKPKRSKYSTLSSTVDKALSVIQKELEIAAGNGRTESGLRERVKVLEQEMRVKDGVITLLKSEVEGLRIRREEVGDGGGSEGMRALMEENGRLKVEVGRKEGELRGWRERLKSLMDGDVG